MTETSTVPSYEGWALLELMGHRQRIGYVRDVEMFGGRLLRIDIPVQVGPARLADDDAHPGQAPVQVGPARLADDDAHPGQAPDAGAGFITEFYGGAAIYALRPVTEEVARDAARRRGDPRPPRPVGYRLEDRREENLDD